MPRTTALSKALAGVDVDAGAARFHARFSKGVKPSLPPTSVIRKKRPRKPQPKNSISPSIFRPHVLAADRLAMWSTPVTLSFHACLTAALPPSDARAMLEVMLFSLEEGTRSNYGAGILRFTQYCDSRKIPEEDRMPASEILLSGFATVMAAGKVASSTLDTWLAGIHFWHSMHGAAWSAGNMLRSVKGGVAKLVPEASKRAKRPPVTIEHLHALRRGLDLSSSLDAAVWSAATIAFWSCCRLGELLVPTRFSFPVNKHVTKNCPQSFRTDVGGTSSFSFHVPWTKTTKFDGADIIVTKINEPTDPLAALKHHLETNKSIPSSAPFFSFRTAGGGHAPLTKQWFMVRCEQVWVEAGLPKLDGHAFRIGGATELLLRGVPPDVVATQGRWKSKSFLEYWRRIEGILPLFIHNAFSSSRAALVRETMKSYSSRICRA